MIIVSLVVHNTTIDNNHPKVDPAEGLMGSKIYTSLSLPYIVFYWFPRHHVIKIEATNSHYTKKSHLSITK